MPFPYIKESVQAAVLSATSNILAQGITAYRKDIDFVLNTTTIIQFMVYALLNTPLNCAWQEWLEATFPGSNNPDPEKSHPAGRSAYQEKKSEKNSVPNEAKRTATAKTSSLNVKNTLIKFLLDQTIGAAFNTVAFVAGMGALRGLNQDQIVLAVQNDSMPIYWTGLKLWPAMSLISFTLVPVDKRVIFGSIVGVAWGIILSLQVAS